MQHEVGGKAAAEVFEDPKVASLAEAACRGDGEAVKRAAAQGADVNYRGLEGVSPLLWALSCESVEGMGALLQEGADPNAADDGGSTALYYAATYRNPELLRLLLKRGGNPNIVNASGYTPLEAAVSYLSSTGSTVNFDVLIDAGADPFLRNANGDSIVEIAAYRNQYELVYRLLKNGYDGDKGRLLRIVQTGAISSTSPQAPWRDRVLALLEKA
ncbi:MAG TPA: ankyrin repeat domain-containing protein [Allosphingosinicella sp.]|nr:ankyrin repeat domain-containing protein [Allosphingosinicella sp.]